MNALTGILSFSFQLFSLMHLKDVMDIIVVALAIYLAIIFIKQTRSYFILYALVLLFGLNYLAKVFDLGLTRQMFQPLLTFLLLIFVVVFQREIRRFIEWFSFHSRRLGHNKIISLSADSARTITDAVFEMAKKKIGAIIVFAGDYPLDTSLEGGFSLDGKISKPLLFSIFDTSSPGHDGAIIIDNNRVKRFGVHLPLAENFNKFSVVGTRHRATAGITQRTDALAVVVSEERGEVSISEGGELVKVEDPTELEETIRGFMKDNLADNLAPNGWSFLLKKNLWIKILSAVMAVALWFIYVFQIGIVNQDLSVPIEFRNAPKNLTMDQVLPKEVNLTFSGNYSDFSSLNKKDLKVVVDLKDTSVGWQKINLSEENVNYPPYFTLVGINPQTVKIDFQPAATGSDETSPLNNLPNI